VFSKLRDERVEAKKAGNKVKDAGLKVSINGQFGKLGSPYSVLYAPHLMITVTLTGQLALLMLIERAEGDGIEVVSGNTDGVVFRCPRDREDDLTEITKWWEGVTGFDLEHTRYKSIYNQSVNSYIAVKEDGKVKLKGPIGNPWRDGDVRGQLMKNPTMLIVSNAVVDFITKGIPIEDTSRGDSGVRNFITVVNVKGGGTWRGQYLGKVVRYAWVKDGDEIFYKSPHERTGNFKKVSRTDGCRPLMQLPDTLPSDINYDAYIEAAYEMLMDYGYNDRPDPIKPIRIFRYNAILHWALAV